MTTIFPLTQTFRQTVGQKDRQTIKHTDRQSGRTDRRTYNSPTEGQIDDQIEPTEWTYRQMEIQTDDQTNGQTEWTDIQKNIQNRQMDSQTKWQVTNRLFPQNQIWDEWSLIHGEYWLHIFFSLGWSNYWSTHNGFIWGQKIENTKNKIYFVWFHDKRRSDKILI